MVEKAKKGEREHLEEQSTLEREDGEGMVACLSFSEVHPQDLMEMV